MSTFESLPPETFDRLLEMASDHDAEALTYSAVLKTFAAASLVARSWREPAQARCGSVSSLLVGCRRAGSWRAHCVASFGPRGWRCSETKGSLDDNGTVEKVLAKIKGLRYLSLAGVNRHFDSALLSLPSLEGA